MKKKIKDKKSELEAMKINELASQNLVSTISQHIIPYLIATLKASNCKRG